MSEQAEVVVPDDDKLVVAVHIDPKDSLTPAEELLAEVLARIARRTNARLEVAS